MADPVKYLWNPPPHWPVPPEGWVPQAGWKPDPAWGPPPEGWVFWVLSEGQVPQAKPAFRERLAMRSAERQTDLIKKMIAKYGGSLDDVWAIGQAGDGFVRFDGSFVEIRHSGVLSRLTVGKGAKRLPLRAITAIQIKPPGPVVSGYIQFTIGGSNEVRAKFGRQSFDAASDENTIMFTKPEQPYFEAFRTAVETAMAAPLAAAAPPTGLAQEIRELAALRDEGILTEEEFAARKATILSRR